VEPSAPTAADDFDVDLGIGTGCQRPKNIVCVCYIDVIVNDDGVATKVGASMTVRSDHPGSPRRPGRALFYGSNGQQPAASGLVAPNAGHVRNTRLFQFLPDQ